jgi:hypothetical protein
MHVMVRDGAHVVHILMRHLSAPPADAQTSSSLSSRVNADQSEHSAIRYSMTWSARPTVRRNANASWASTWRPRADAACAAPTAMYHCRAGRHKSRRLRWRATAQDRRSRLVLALSACLRRVILCLGNLRLGPSNPTSAKTQLPIVAPSSHLCRATSAALMPSSARPKVTPSSMMRRSF